MVTSQHTGFMSTRGLSKVPISDQKAVKAELARISDEIKKRRLAYGYTQESLAEELDVSPETIRFIEQNIRVPSLAMLIRISKILKFKIIA